MAPQWEITSVKAQLRTASQRLGHLQDKNDSKGSITRRDIATLLDQGNVGLARLKAQKLYQEDLHGGVLEILEMHVGLILEHILELENNTPSPAVMEAASSIIYASPRIDSKDLQVVRDTLANRLGPEFVRASIVNRDRVSDRIVKKLSTSPPNATQLDVYLLSIARVYGVQWHPDPRRQDIVGSLSEILDQQSSPAVDVARIRKLCARGIPDEPACLRPRIWRVLLGSLPVLKSSWARETPKQRESYYDLVRRLLEPFANLPEPTTPLSSQDLSLLRAAQQLSGIPDDLFSGLQDEPELSNLCPFDSSAKDDIKMSCAENLNIRLKAIQKIRRHESSSSTPEIRLESDDYVSPPPATSTTESQNVGSTLLHASKALDTPHTHEKHTSALLRLLFVHGSVNPGNLSPHMPALLLPLYSVLNQEVESDDLAHVEADTFWMFETMVGEFSELEDEEGGNVWMRKFSERLNWADTELRDNLLAKGLDPALPHYSYRWMAPLFTQTLPLSSVIVVWDALFACQMRERQNFKVEFLVDICTAMLIRARTALFRLGKREQPQNGLWSEDAAGLPPLSPLRPWELSDAFVQGMALLQHYPIDAAGGIDSILQTASELRHRREDEAKLVATNSLTLGDRLRLSVWKGFTNQSPSPDSSSTSETSDEEETSGNDTETQEVAIDSGLTARLATTVWRGITNQAAMEPPPSPMSPTSPFHQPSPSIVVDDTSDRDSQIQEGSTESVTTRLASTVWRGITNQAAMEPPPSPLSISPLGSPQSPSVVITDSEPSMNSPKGWSSGGLWSYAEKLKESNAAATLSKVSSNWQAKALAGTWGIRKGTANQPMPPQPQSADSVRYSAPPQNVVTEAEARRTSAPDVDRLGLYSPPTRPAFFKPPRDTMIFSGNGPIIDVPSSPELSPTSEGGLMQKTRNLQASLAALTRGSELATPQNKPKSGPRPLLLGSTSVIAPRGERMISRSENSTPVSGRKESGQWSEVMQARSKAGPDRDSLSSVSSLSPSDALMRGKFDYESDGATPSRKVALNRRSVSPMALHARTNSVTIGSAIPPVPHFRSDSTPHLSLSSSSGSSSGGAALGSPIVTSPLGPKSPGWGQVHIPDSPEEMRSPSLTNSIKNTIPEETSEKNPLDDPIPPLQSRKLSWKKTPTTPGDTSDSSVPELPKRSTRVLRSKRNTKLPNLRIQQLDQTAVSEPTNTVSPSSLAVEWPREEQELATTPKAPSFDADSSSSPKSPKRPRKVSDSRSPTVTQRKLSGDGQEPRLRKISMEGRTRKTSETKVKRHRESNADMGDDEGYDELLSAYESEET